MSKRFFVEPDGDDQPSIWELTPGTVAVADALVLRKADLPGPHDELLWRVVTGVLAPDDATVERVARALYVHGDDLSLDDAIADRYRATARAVLAALADPADTGGAS